MKLYLTLVGVVAALNATCRARTPEESASLEREIEAYMLSPKFQAKIEEVAGSRDLGSRQLSIDSFLRSHVFQRGQSLLDMGCAAGAMIKLFQQSGVRAVGVELVDGWVRAANAYALKVIKADITDVRLDSTFDVITLNDVVEHVQPERYPCLFQSLQAHSHVGTAVYMHTPSPEQQLRERRGQYYENVVGHDDIVVGMAHVGFQLERFEYDIMTDCGMAPAAHLKQHTRCYDRRTRTPRYTHFLFRYAPLRKRNAS